MGYTLDVAWSFGTWLRIMHTYTHTNNVVAWKNNRDEEQKRVFHTIFTSLALSLSLISQSNWIDWFWTGLRQIISLRVCAWEQISSIDFPSKQAPYICILFFLSTLCACLVMVLVRVFYLTRYLGEVIRAGCWFQSHALQWTKWMRV